MIKKQVGVAAVVFVLTGTLGVAPAFAVSGGEVSECVPVEAYVETVLGSPGVDAVYETVVISEAGWQRYSFNGRWDSSEAPKFPDDRWQRNTASDPHKVGVAGAYFRSSGNSGKGDWFYLEAILAVTEKVLVSEAVAAGENTFIEHPAVVCNPVVPDPVVPDPVAPVVPDPTPEPVVPVEPTPEPVVQPTPVDAVPTVATPATLAVTGSTNTVPAMLLALLLTLTGLAAVLFGKREKGIR